MDVVHSEERRFTPEGIEIEIPTDETADLYLPAILFRLLKGIVLHLYNLVRTFDWVDFGDQSPH